MKSNESNLTKRVFLLFPMGIVITSLILFLPAGSLRYWHAWIFLGIIFTPTMFIALYFWRRDPGLLKRRIEFREKEAEQKTIMKIVHLLCLVGLVLAGFDYRYGWSRIPLWFVILSAVLVFLGYLLIFFVFKENSWASRTVEVERKQKVITTGPYSVIRHPMYAGMILMFLFMPLALGSYWALLFFVPIIALIILRTVDEEEFLLRDLKGYREYYQKVKYRLLPGIW